MIEYLARNLYADVNILVLCLRELAPSRNVVCTVTSSIRMAWTLSLNISTLCENPVVEENLLILVIDRG